MRGYAHSWWNSTRAYAEEVRCGAHSRLPASRLQDGLCDRGAHLPEPPHQRQGREGRVGGGLYFLPAARIIVHGPLFTDFVTRKDFILGELPEGLFRELKDQTGTIRISLGNVAEMAMREYPLVQLDPAWVEALNTPEPQARTGGP